MTVQSPPEERKHLGGPSQWSVGAVILWLAALVAGLAGVALAYLGSAYEASWHAWTLIPAVPFWLLLGLAVFATVRAKGRRPSIAVVLLASGAAAAVIVGGAGLLGWAHAQQEAAGACSAEELAQFEALSFYDQLDQPPQGDTWGNCYALYTVDETGQSAWVAMQQLLIDDGWRHQCEPNCPDDVTYHYGILTKDGFEILVDQAGGAGPGAADYQPAETAGSTTFSLSIVQDARTLACSEDEVAVLTGISDAMYVTAGYVGEGQAVVEGQPDGRCVTRLGFQTQAQADQVLRESMDTLGWTLVAADSGRFTFQMDNVQVEAAVTNAAIASPGLDRDPEEAAFQVAVWMP